MTKNIEGAAGRRRRPCEWLAVNPSRVPTSTRPGTADPVARASADDYVAGNRLRERRHSNPAASPKSRSGQRTEICRGVRVPSVPAAR